MLFELQDPLGIAPATEAGDADELRSTLDELVTCHGPGVVDRIEVWMLPSGPCSCVLLDADDVIALIEGREIAPAS